jgi:hypothetical protein
VIYLTPRTCAFVVSFVCHGIALLAQAAFHCERVHVLLGARIGIGGTIRAQKNYATAYYFSGSEQSDRTSERIELLVASGYAQRVICQCIIN